MALPLINYQVAHAGLVIDAWTTAATNDLQIINRERFVAQMTAFAADLPIVAHVINLCQNRYYFMLAFAAACVRGQTNLLPANQASGALQALCDRYPNHCLIDDDYVRASLDTKHEAKRDAENIWPTLADDHIAAIAFTSGSTGQPQEHHCTWSTLMQSAQRSAARIFTQRNLQLVATIPPQHMFGLETTILQPFVNDCVIHSGKPFFPGEIFAALRSVQAPRALITTPAHLKNCFAAAMDVPALEFVLSATAPLDPDLAIQVERAWHTQVLEIYGSTETGAIATRRTAQGQTWELLPGGELIDTDAGIAYRAHGAAQSVLLHDVLVRSDATHFNLGARNHDLIKFAGKRASLAELNARLLAIDGVSDGVIFQPAPDARVAALVVTNTLSARDIHNALAVHIDPIFLPRPLHLVASLPRDALGKLPRAQLLAALERT